MPKPNLWTTPLVDPRTGLVTQAWKLFFQALETTGASGGSGVVASGALSAYELVVADPLGRVRTLGARGLASELLHGNPGGYPTWGPVRLGSEVSGNLPVRHLNSGTDANDTRFWRGDAKWVVALTSIQAGTNISVNNTNPNSPVIASPAFADPTGTIGFTAVNGTEVTVLRSDAAPALSLTLVTPDDDSFSLSTASDPGAATTRGDLLFTAGSNSDFTTPSSLTIGGAGAVGGVFSAVSGGAMTLTATTSCTIAAGLDLVLTAGGNTTLDSTNSTVLTSGGVVQVEANQTEWNIATSAAITAASLDIAVSEDTFLILDGNLHTTVGVDATIEVTGELQITGSQNVLLGAIGDISCTSGAALSLDADTDVTLVSLTGNVIIGADAGELRVIGPSLKIVTAGQGLEIAEGTNARMGLATLSGGTVTVNTTAVTTTSRIFLTAQDSGTIATPAALEISARTANTSFTISSADVADDRGVAWVIINLA